MSEQTIAVQLLHQPIELKVSEVWPDGDAPAVVTAEAVKERMEACGGKLQVLIDWCLVHCLDVHVGTSCPNPGYVQDEVLFGDPPPKILDTACEVWA